MTDEPVRSILVEKPETPPQRPIFAAQQLAEAHATLAWAAEWVSDWDRELLYEQHRRARYEYQRMARFGQILDGSGGAAGGASTSEDTSDGPVPDLP